MKSNVVFKEKGIIEFGKDFEKNKGDLKNGKV